MIYFIIAFLIILLDQGAKYFVTLKYGMGGSLDLIPGILRITYHTNSGGAFSMLDNYTLILTIVSAVVVVGIIVLLIVSKWSGFGKLSLAFILGGAVGNLIDRVILKYVVDMFYPLFVNFAIFNVADIFITIGAVLFILFILFGNKHAGEQKLTPKERKKERLNRKYGPDVDESTISIPADEIKAAEQQLRETADEIEPEGDDVTVVYRNPMVTEADIAAAQKDAEEKKEYSLEDIMREYGHDF
ncbi:MAG: signal peptidase II [Oscillospiraceae bacterium]|nr:signal peptidase II [Oscillospiraceae bacterium]